jgi:hypothetical protein
MTIHGTQSTAPDGDQTKGGDALTAIISMLYLLLVLALVGWLLFDTWTDVHTLPRWGGYEVTPLRTPAFHLLAYAVIGGALGGVLNGIRSVLLYYADFDRQYVWKYIAAPWMGAALALLGYALLRSTIAVVGGQGTPTQADSTQMLANFAIGALAGYGAKDVFIWLDVQVHKLFAVTEATPDLQGQPKPVAVSRLQAQDLTVGAVTTVPASKATPAGTVLDQAPAPGTSIPRGDAVDLIIADEHAATNGESDGSAPAGAPPSTAPTST